MLASVMYPAWEWGPAGMPTKRYLSASHNKDLSTLAARNSRELIRSDWYQSLWPHVQIVKDMDGKGSYANTATGMRQAQPYTSLTGYRADRLILDDVISAEDANSNAALDEASRIFCEQVPTRVNNDESAIIVIMQRLSERDISGEILSRNMGYTHLCIPMRYEHNRKCSTSIGWTDPRSQDGELMFPQRWGDDKVRELEASLGQYGTAGQLQQRPSPRGGGLIKTDWIRLYDYPPDVEYIYLTADTAAKTGQQNDYSVIQTWGRTDDGCAVLLDQHRGKHESPDLIKIVRGIWSDLINNSDVPVEAIYCEDASSGTGLMQTLRREGVPILPIKRGGGKSKYERAYIVCPYIECGNVYIPRISSYTDTLLSEIADFPAGAHDDQVDAFVDACVIAQYRRTPKNLDVSRQIIPTRRLY